MNEHIQELITAYLHRGSTTEQERELFDACKRDPEIAEQLRQHLILSLKLRQLRDDVTVGEDLHAAMARRIDSLAPSVEESVVYQPAPRRFSLAQVFGTGMATAAAAAVLVLLLLPDPEPLSLTASNMQPVADTVFVVEKDTVTQVREVTRNVYLAAQTPSAERVRPEASETPDAITDRHLADRGDTVQPEDITQAEDTVNDASATDRTPPPVDNRDLADARPIPSENPGEATRNYLDQYNAMLVSVASVELTSADRIAH